LLIAIGVCAASRNLNTLSTPTAKSKFADAFAELPALERHSKIVLQTHLTYEKQLRNLHIQESRIDRKRAKAIAELKALQSEHIAQQQQQSADQAVASEHTASAENGFVFSKPTPMPSEHIETERATLSEASSESVIAANALLKKAITVRVNGA
jgi:hypothetical protein